ncbi:MAG: hypothetical protein ACM3MI_10560 [Clostridiales bacterium]
MKIPTDENLSIGESQIPFYLRITFCATISPVYAQETISPYGYDLE